MRPGCLRGVHQSVSCCLPASCRKLNPCSKNTLSCEPTVQAQALQIHCGTAGKARCIARALSSGQMTWQRGPSRQETTYKGWGSGREQKGDIYLTCTSCFETRARAGTRAQRPNSQVRATTPQRLPACFWPLKHVCLMDAASFAIEGEAYQEVAAGSTLEPGAPSCSNSVYVELAHFLLSGSATPAASHGCQRQRACTCLLLCHTSYMPQAIAASRCGSDLSG